jgi:hypothetical protein
MNQDLFQQACDKVIDQQRECSGIGTLGEKTIHAVLKNYLSPDNACQEIKVGNYYADIVIENRIIEIQTRQFNKLKGKLNLFLTLNPVTIVYPVPYTKWLRWINEETGEISAPRKSPKSGTPYMIFPELYRIKEHLLNPNLNLHIILMDMEEYRFLNGWSKDKKKGSTRSDRIPIQLIDEIIIESLEDYNKLIPANLKDNFTSKDFQKATRLSQTQSATALNILNHVGAVNRIGKKGRAYLYSR